MKTNIFYKLLILLPIFITGCIGIFSEEERLPNGDYDIVFQTEEDGNDIIGFYSLSNGIFDNLKTTKNLSSPYVLEETNLIAIKKIADYGDPTPNSGYITILRKASQADLQAIQKLSNSGDPRANIGNITRLDRASQGLSCKKDDFWTYLIRPYGNQFVFYWDGVFNIMDPKECKIVSELLNLQDVGIDTELYQNLEGFSVNPQTNFLVLAIENRSQGIFNMVRVILLTKAVLNYEKFGINPSISPDGKKVAYLSEDGIRIMDIEGNDVLKVSDDIPWRKEEGASFDYLWPNPAWSSDGKQLIYHKCLGIKKPHYLCEEYGKYSVFLYDFKTGIERKLFDSGVNPSWINR